MKTRWMWTAVALVAALGACAPAEDDAASDPEGSSEDALSAGTLDKTMGALGRVEGNEKLLGERGQRFAFFGRDEQGAYVARRTRKLVLDPSYGAAGKVYVDATKLGPKPLMWDAALLADGRIVLTGSADRGQKEYVLDGIGVQPRALVVVVVSADGASQKAASFNRLATAPYVDYDQGYRAYTFGGTSVAALADGRVAVGASVGLYDSNNSQARLYAFDVVGLDAVFAGQLWEGGRQSIYGSTTNYGTAAVTSLVEAAPGTFLVGTSGRLDLVGDELARSAKGNYSVVTAKAGAPAETSAAYGVAGQYERTVAARLADGRFLFAGGQYYGCRGVALRRLGTDLASDEGFGTIPGSQGARCVPIGGVKSAVAIAPAGTRTFVVMADFRETEVWALDADGNVDATFASGQPVKITGTASAAFASGSYLYIQLWDHYTFNGGGASGKGHFRRMKI